MFLTSPYIDQAIALKTSRREDSECNGEWLLKKSLRLAGGI
jgi:hypothetical protein